MHSKDIAILPPFLSLPLYSVCSASLVLKILCSCQVVCLQKNLRMHSRWSSLCIQISHVSEPRARVWFRD